MIFINIFQRKKVTVFFSQVNKKIKVVNSLGGKIVYVDGAEQTGGTITGMWRKTVKRLPDILPEKILVLGLGGGDLIRILRKKYPKGVITCVEIDPVMIKIARDYFRVESGSKLKIIKADASRFVGKTKARFDFIFIDLFLGPKNPSQFRTMDFLKKIKWLNSGSVIYNSHYDEQNPQEFDGFLALCRKVFKKSEIIVSYRFSRILFLA